MLNIKSLSTGVAAAALVSVIGLAYAQTAPATTDTPPAATQPSTTMAPSGTPMTNSPSSTTNPSDTMNGTTSTTEPAPQADRN